MATNLGLSIQVSQPLIQGGAYLGGLRPDAYSHEITAIGGYWQAVIDINLNQQAIEEWLEIGIGRHIEVFNADGMMIFEGFVNVIRANIGGLSVERGELLNIGNSCTVTYSTVDTSTSPPTVGIRASTSEATDTTSQVKYGVVKKYLSTGGSNGTIASQLRDTYLAEYKQPETKQSLNLSGGGLNISLTVLGYIHWAKNYAYNSLTTGTQNLSDKLEAVLGAEVNGFFSTDYSNIASNTTAVKAWENDNKQAWDLITGMTALGDSSDNRYIFGMYEGRKARYEAIPTDAEYQQRLSAGQIETITGRQVKLYDVMPGKWLFIPDFMIGRTPNTSNLREDPRNIFIESVQYTAPYGLQIQGGKVDSLSQKLARLGLSGIGA